MQYLYYFFHSFFTVSGNKIKNVNQANEKLKKTALDMALESKGKQFEELATLLRSKGAKAISKQSGGFPCLVL